jgi:glycosyltransferase involved in cell wall biosynthesis
MHNFFMLPIGVVIPTKNSIKYLPGHVENLAAWIDQAEQVVVVDSFSTDGTVDYLKRNLRHPKIKFIEHPPGLYASWNYGIRQISSEFCYIATVGDSITRAGLEHLATAASRLNCDVLVSRPEFVNEAGQPCDGPEWPMDTIIERLKLLKPVRLHPAIILATALTHAGGAITGSCASDLFHTVTLQKHPFPLDFGVAGDGAWSLQNAGRVKWAATPEKVTTFRRHPPTASTAEVNAGQTANQFAQIAETVVSEWLESNSGDAPVEVCKNIRQLMPLSIEHEKSRRQYNFLRKQKWPWILNPSAWAGRSKRNQLKSQVYSLTQNIYNRSFQTAG